MCQNSHFSLQLGEPTKNQWKQLMKNKVIHIFSHHIVYMTNIRHLHQRWLSLLIFFFSSNSKVVKGRGRKSPFSSINSIDVLRNSFFHPWTIYRGKVQFHRKNVFLKFPTNFESFCFFRFCNTILVQQPVKFFQKHRFTFPLSHSEKGKSIGFV